MSVQTDTWKKVRVWVDVESTHIVSFVVCPRCGSLLLPGAAETHADWHLFARV
jgi:hypothetical protein